MSIFKRIRKKASRRPVLTVDSSTASSGASKEGAKVAEGLLNKWLEEAREELKNKSE